MPETYFEPKIVAVLCTWCAYSGADGAGQARTSYAPNLKVVRVMCTGRVDPSFVIEALAAGADGVLVAGCHPGDCHYINGNCKAMGRMPLLRRMLSGLGIEPERVRLEWVSAAEGTKYAEIVGEMVEQLRALGPLGWKRSVPPGDGVTSADDDGRVETMPGLEWTGESATIEESA